ncbi:MAG TPA: hypothetical protein VFK12_04515, partial [Gammaproteobacteria bacterium]|nr:hypothetical protein [Gammaproteobacteria bacterium]
MPIHDEIRALGWLQGSFFSEANNGRLAELIGAEIPEGSLALVITHTCDLVHPSIRAEPYVELIVATRLIGNPDPGCENCRSTRKLHLPVQYSDGRTGHIELKQAATCRISRELLQELPPSRDVSLSHDEKIKLTSWLALRYMRATFPDNFERR